MPCRNLRQGQTVGAMPMSMTDPITITVNAVPYVCACVDTSGSTKVYKDPSDAMIVTISHLATKAGRTSRMVKVQLKKISADPFTPTINREVSSTVQTVINEPSDGMFTNTELLNLKKGLAAWETDANVGKLLSGES
nr:MAG: hypothetical protein 2 [Leviviridae sp.]